ncbi:5-formyltetrahydrofolate cyclo-ligase [Neobacillus sp. LXY-1]|uniref:5-formyltetrahydrofolate cyclo-ligase n=1 Tax=Neobacillus sp. LXY-1 TaxID=3379133 RepID=UPI003EDFF29F
MFSNKSEIRAVLKEKLAGITKPIYEDYSYKIARQLYETEEWKYSKVVGITISKQPEVDTYQIIRKAWEEGKTVVVPKCHPKDKSLIFRTLTKFSQLESVYYGLYEPIETQTDAVDPNEIALLIVPGLGYTPQGYRLGFGGGYYDRFLAQYSGSTLSLAFHEQIIPHFPIEEYDLPVAKIITPNQIVLTK